MSTWRSTYLSVLLCVAVVAGGCTDEVSWKAVQTTITAAYPDVESVSTDSLAQWLSDSTAVAPILLDVRTEAEYDVSHLRDAIRIDPELEDFSSLDSLPDRPLVLYCSVGYRSAAMAARLKEAGFPNVSNLSGSIFRWANEGRPVYRDGRQVQEVHPYDGVWGRLLDAERRAH